jgi:hypothetical protein
LAYVAKLPVLRHNPAVALTIETEVHPPKILLIRGRAELDVVEGIPDDEPEQRVEWEAEVRSLYDGSQETARSWGTRSRRPSPLGGRASILGSSGLPALMA